MIRYFTKFETDFTLVLYNFQCFKDHLIFPNIQILLYAYFELFSKLIPGTTAVIFFIFIDYIQ